MVLSVRRSYLKYLFSVFNLPFLPVYNDLQFKYKIDLNEKNKLTILGIAAIIIAIEVPTLKRKSMKKELWLVCILTLFGTTLAIAQTLHIPLLNPADWIIAVYKPISDIVYI